MTLLSGIRSGAIAGAISSFVFTLVHHLLISDIWSTIVAMLASGILCGLCLGGTYAMVTNDPSIRSWLRFNSVFLAMFVLLGIASVIIYDPVTTITTLIQANAPPSDLINIALPLIGGFTLVISILVSLMFGHNWRHYFAIFMTCFFLMLLLGLNVSIIGLVYVPTTSLYLIVELFGLTVVLNLVYAISFIVLEKNQLIKTEKEAVSV
jgi:hypothetical protein